ncbi:hypothetical protein FHT97_004270 [Rhizobium sp. BK399]|nr:hypothetical protein [Rhizobium sp. BK399]
MIEHSCSLRCHVVVDQRDCKGSQTLARLLLVGALIEATALIAVGCSSIEAKGGATTVPRRGAITASAQDCSKKPNYEGMLRTLCY